MVPVSLKVASHLPQLTTLSASRTVSRPSRRSRRRSVTRHSGGLGPSEMRFGQVEAVEASLTAPWPHNALSATPDKARHPRSHSEGVHPSVDDWNMPQTHRHLYGAPPPAFASRPSLLSFPFSTEARGRPTYRWTGAQLRVVHSPPRNPVELFAPSFRVTGGGRV